MTIGLIGLGRIGSAVAYRLMRAGHAVIGFDPSGAACVSAQEQGVTIAISIEQIAQQSHIIWIFVPAGPIVDDLLRVLITHMRPGDIVIDGGNSNYKDSIERARVLHDLNLFFVDCGTSGGLHGKEHGFCLMVGGNKQAYTKIEPMLLDVAAPGGVAYVGPSGAGHYVKMVHNAIEYGLLQAYAEGMQLLKEGSFKNEDLDLAAIAHVWEHGSIIRSWILDLLENVLERDQQLENVMGQIDETGTGRWAVEDAQKNSVPLPVIETSLKVRAQSRESGDNYATKLVAMLRHEFGGHSYKEKK